MADKKGAYGSNASQGSFRRTWDDEAYREKAREKDKEEKERMQENEERIRKGKRPHKGKKEDLPKPTEFMKQREGSLELEKNLNKTIIVQSMRGPGQPGFFCEICNKTSKDSQSYLDHINGRSHLRRLGQTTKVARSNVEQVRARIALLREKTREASQAKSYDFHQRLAEIKAKEEALRVEKAANKQREKDAARALIVLDSASQAEQVEMASLMGFGGFGSTKR